MHEAILKIIRDCCAGRITDSEAMDRLETFMDPDKSNRDWYEGQILEARRAVEKQLKQLPIEKPK